MKQIELIIHPKGYVTRTHKGRFSKRAEAYHQYCNALIEMADRRDGFRLPASFDATFYIPMPKSWGKGKKYEMDGKPHQQKPDYSNLLKAVEDALHRGDDDSYIHEVSGRKVWSESGKIVIRWEESNEDEN